MCLLVLSNKQGQENVGFVPQGPPATQWVCPLGAEVKEELGFARLELGLCNDIESQAKIVWLCVEGLNLLSRWTTTPPVS